MVILASSAGIASVFVFLYLFGYFSIGVNDGANASTSKKAPSDTTKLKQTDFNQSKLINESDTTTILTDVENSDINSLRINLVSFTGKIHDESKMLLKWITATETNTDYFTVYKSVDGVDFTEFEKVLSKGSSTNIQYYSLLDENPFPGISYYKLTQTDLEGNSFDLKIAKLEFEGYKKDSKIIIWPNPFIDRITMNIPDGFDNEVKVVIFEISGKIAIEATIAVNDYDKEIEITSLDKISPGQYILKVFRGSSVSEGVKIIKK